MRPPCPGGRVAHRVPRQKPNLRGMDKIGARDWCYVLEVAGSLTKGEFDTAEKPISACRKDGHLPVDVLRHRR